LLTAVPPVPPAVAIAPVGITTTADLANLAIPATTSLHVARQQLNVLSGRRATVTGTLRGPGRTPLSRRKIVLETHLGRRWRALAWARTNATGRFRLTYSASRPGSRAVRVSFPGDAFDRPAHRRLGQLNVFRLALASWYGGGGSLACGGTLTSSTLGVANKTLPCGTIVTLHYGSRTVRVPVVDRGPYVEGREFDLTEATKQALGFEGVGQVWTTR
jgi:rare lipoprotein A